MRLCEECGKPFAPEEDYAVVCPPCCAIPDDQICFDHLHLGEGSMECDWARKDHPQPHKWEGVIDGAAVRVEWKR